MNRLAVVHLKPYLAFQNYRVVDSVRPMYPGIFAFKGVTQTGKTFGVFLGCRRGIERGPRSVGGGVRDNVKRRAAWPRNQRLRIAARLLLLAQVRDAAVLPKQRVFETWTDLNR